MTTIFAAGGIDQIITEDVKRQAVRAAVEHARDVSRTLALPPDGTRIHSDAGTLTRMLYEEVGPGGLCDVMPALGTHFPMEWDELRRMFGDVIPLERFCEHRWREDLVRLGEVPSDYVHKVSGGVLRESMPDYGIPVEVNRRLVEGGYTAVFSLGQVVPHEVIGMANEVKNVLVGVGGGQTIHRSHFLGAAYGMERIMGRADTPVRDRPQLRLRPLPGRPGHHLHPHRDGAGERGRGRHARYLRRRRPRRLPPGRRAEPRGERDAGGRAAGARAGAPGAGRVQEHVAGQQGRLPHAHDDGRRRRADRHGAGREDLRRGPGDRPPDPPLRLPRHAGHARRGRAPTPSCRPTSPPPPT